MIHFEITTSPDNNVIAPFQFFQNQIYLGKSDGDLWIDDSHLKTSHAMLEVIENDLIIHPQKEIEYYLINGKRASTVRKIKVNDEITIGRTVLKIIAFKETVKASKKEILDQKMQGLLKNASPRLNVIESLSQKMK